MFLLEFVHKQRMQSKLFWVDTDVPADIETRVGIERHLWEDLDEAVKVTLGGKRIDHDDADEKVKSLDRNVPHLWFKVGD